MEREERSEANDIFCEKGKISIIVPVYNAETFLRDTLNDLLAQTYENKEIILINDGSTDQTLQIIEEYALQYPEIKVRTIINGGPGRCRNVGLQEAIGEFVRFIDADDRIPKTSLSSMVLPYGEYEEIDLVIGNYMNIPYNGHYEGNDLQNGVINISQFADLFLNNVKSFYIGVPWNKLYKREIIERNNIRFDENIKWCEDFLFNVKYYEVCRKIYICNVQEGVYQYYLRETSITNTLRKRFDQMELDEIDTIRYERAQSFCRKMGKLYEFELEWKYTTIYVTLSVLARDIKVGHVVEHYRRFKTILLEDENIYQYICMKYRKQGLFMWKALKNAIEKNSYRKVFALFVIKGVLSKYISPFKKLLKGKMKLPTC